MRGDDVQRETALESPTFPAKKSMPALASLSVLPTHRLQSPHENLDDTNQPASCRWSMALGPASSRRRWLAAARQADIPKPAGGCGSLLLLYVRGRAVSDADPPKLTCLLGYVLIARGSEQTSVKQRACTPGRAGNMYCPGRSGDRQFLVSCNDFPFVIHPFHL